MRSGKKKKTSSVRSVVDATPVPRLQELITSGKTRQAVEEAKAYHKAVGSAESEELLAQAHIARIASLIDGGISSDAAARIRQALERFPRHRDELRALEIRLALSVGDLDSLLVRIASAEGADRLALESELTRWLTDPAVVAGSCALSPDDPLKNQALAVTSLFGAVTRGPLPSDALQSLDGIHRNSPLAPWKLVIRAIHAFYSRSDSMALANIEGVPQESPAWRIADVLRAMIENPGETRGLHAESFLMERILGGRGSLIRSVDGFERAVVEEDQRQAREALRSLGQFTRQLSPAEKAVVRRTVLEECMNRTPFGPDIVARALGLDSDRSEMTRMVALSLEGGSWVHAVEFWSLFLDLAKKGGTKLDGWEEARVLRHIERLFPADHEIALDDLGFYSEEDLREGIRSEREPWCFDRIRLLARAAELDPSQDHFERLSSEMLRLNRPGLDDVADRWRNAFPADPAPLVLLARSASARNDLPAALEWFRNAAVLGRLDSRARDLRVRLLVRQATSLLDKGQSKAALEIVTEMEAIGLERDQGLVSLALRAAAAPDGPLHNEASAELVVRSHSALLSRLLLMAILRVEPGGLLPGEIGKPGEVEVLDAVARAFELFSGFDLPVPAGHPVFAAVVPMLKRATVEQLLAIGQGAFVAELDNLAYQTSGAALLLDGPMVHRFLMLRADVLLRLDCDDLERICECLEAAQILAVVNRDGEAVSEIELREEQLPDHSHTRGQALMEPLARAQVVVRREAKARIPRTLSGEKRSKAPRKKTPRGSEQGSLFDLLKRMAGMEDD